MNESILRADRDLSEVISCIEPYALLTPVNIREEREKFIKELGKGAFYQPQYVYPRKDLTVYKEKLDLIKKRICGEEPLEQLLRRKADMVLGMLELLSSDDLVLPVRARGLWGLPKKDVLDTSRHILMKAKDERYAYPSENVTPCEMMAAIEEEMGIMGINWKVSESQRIVPKMTVSPRQRAIYVNPDFDYTLEEIDRLKVHELKVHVLRAINGERQGLRLFSEGTAGYNCTEEGLALYAESKAGIWEKDTRQLKLYAGRALGVDLASRMGFYETYSALLEYFPEDIAFRIAERSKRGLDDTSLPGGLYSGHHYMTGFKEVSKYFMNGGDVRVLYAGKISLEDVPIIEKMITEGKIKRAEKVPSFFKTELRRSL